MTTEANEVIIASNARAHRRLVEMVDEGIEFEIGLYENNKKYIKTKSNYYHARTLKEAIDMAYLDLMNSV